MQLSLGCQQIYVIQTIFVIHIIDFKEIIFCQHPFNHFRTPFLFTLLGSLFRLIYYEKKLDSFTDKAKAV